MAATYRGRIAPTPTGDLHLGHARTFRAAWARAREEGGDVVLRIEDLDTLRCRPEYTAGALADLHWMGVDWDEGPFRQSERTEVFVDCWRRLRDAGVIYPSEVSRKEVRNAALAPHEDEEGAEPLFPVELRAHPDAARHHHDPFGTCWRFRVPNGASIRFHDARCGPQCFVAGVDFGDFVVWRKDGVPAYELAVVADDIAMGITEVVRGEDLLRSTARQLLVYQALGVSPPAWCHEPLLRDHAGRRLAKRHAALALRTLRDRGITVEAALDAVSASPSPDPSLISAHDDP